MSRRRSEQQPSGKSSPTKGDQDEYSKELKRVYNKIDKLSAAMWSIRESTDLVQQVRGQQTRRRQNKGSTALDSGNNWQEESNAQLGYGEIT